MTAPAPAPVGSDGWTGRPRHPDRVDLPTWLLVGLILTTGLAVGCAAWSAASGQGGLEPAPAFGLGVLASVLALLGLPSLSIRGVARAMGAASALGLARFGFLGGTGTASLTTLMGWIVAIVGIVVLSAQVRDAKHPRIVPRAPGDSDGEANRLAPSLARIAAISFGLLLVTALALPHVTDRLRPSSDTGDPARRPNQSDATALLASNTVDMTERPRLSARVVLRVSSPRVTFWRGQTYDIWDGRFWAQSDGGLTALGPDGEVSPLPHDLAAQGTDTFTQRFEMVSPVADLLYGASTPIEVDAPVEVLVRSDGAMLAAEALGSGSSYSITSRRVVASEDDLRAADAGETPDEILTRYATPPVTTARVQAAATRITAGADTTYDRVLAIQEWMGNRTQYSLNAPLAPTDADVVDDFLFESRRGWCEQIASSLVVLARANGIPARLVTGFVPGEQDRLTGEFVVRERNAHAWAEIWFPDVGWVPFDPTADVPLAGDDATERTWSEWLARHTALIALVAIGITVIVALAVLVGRRLKNRRRIDREQRHGGSPSWAGTIDARLDALGERAGRARTAGETATTYAESVGAQLGAPDIGDVGRAIDASLYAPRPPTPQEQTAAGDILDRHEADDSLVPS